MTKWEISFERETQEYFASALYKFEKDVIDIGNQNKCMLDNACKANLMDITDQIDTVDQRTEAAITEQYTMMNDRVNSTYQVKSDAIQAHMETELTGPQSRRYSSKNHEGNHR